MASPDDHAFIPSRDAGLDDADLKIIELLSREGRVNVRSMTRVVGLTEETVAARIRHMVERNILSITVVFDWRAAGYRLECWLRIKCDGDVEGVVESLTALDAVMHVWIVLGKVDVVAQLLIRDDEEALDVLAGHVRRIRGVASIDVAVGLDAVKYFHQFSPTSVAPGSVHLPNPVVPLDEVDRSIVEALRLNGRASNREIGRVLGISDGTVRNRARRLEDAGLIRVLAQVNPTTSGMLRGRALVAVSVQGRDARDVAQDLAAMPEFLLVSLVSGSHAIMAYVGSSSRERLIELLQGRARSIAGIRQFDIYEIAESRKATNHLARW